MVDADRAFEYSMIELAGKRVTYIPEISYVYL